MYSHAGPAPAGQYARASAAPRSVNDTQYAKKSNGYRTTGTTAKYAAGNNGYRAKRATAPSPEIDLPQGAKIVSQSERTVEPAATSPSPTQTTRRPPTRAARTTRTSEEAW